MLRIFKCIEISLSDQTPGASLKFVSGPMRDQLVLCSASIQSIGKCVKYIQSRICPQPTTYVPIMEIAILHD